MPRSDSALRATWGRESDSSNSKMQTHTDAHHEPSNQQCKAVAIGPRHIEAVIAGQTRSRNKEGYAAYRFACMHPLHVSVLLRGRRGRSTAAALPFMLQPLKEPPSLPLGPTLAAVVSMTAVPCMQGHCWITNCPAALTGLLVLLSVARYVMAFAPRPSTPLTVYLLLTTVPAATGPAQQHTLVVCVCVRGGSGSGHCLGTRQDLQDLPDATYCSCCMVPVQLPVTAHSALPCE
jgi:hypothetical protein